MANSVKTADIKDMASSVDWRKMLSSSDAKHALIGSALGGLLLGGSSMMGEKDPEESKYAPVGDALTGALLGGIAGYGIPKGLAMFRDSGSLAPDNDRIRHDYPRAALLGAGVGAGTVGGSLLKTFRDEAKHFREVADNSRAAWRTAAEADHAASVARGDAAELQEFFENRAKMYNVTEEGTREAHRVIDNLRSSLRGKSGMEAKEIKRQIKVLKALRSRAVRGYTDLGDFFKQLGEHGEGMERGGVLQRLARPFIHPKQWFKQFASARNYHSGRLFGRFMRLHPGVRMGLRAGKYGAVGAGLAMLLHKLTGPGSSDNFKSK